MDLQKNKHCSDLFFNFFFDSGLQISMCPLFFKPLLEGDRLSGLVEVGTCQSGTRGASVSSTQRARAPGGRPVTCSRTARLRESTASGAHLPEKPPGTSQAQPRSSSQAGVCLPSAVVSSGRLNWLI